MFDSNLIQNNFLFGMSYLVWLCKIIYSCYFHARAAGGAVLEQLTFHFLFYIIGLFKAILLSKQSSDPIFGSLTTPCGLF